MFEDGGNLEVDGAYCRISRCVWSDAQPGKWIRVRPGSRRIEIDHCRFENKTNNRELPRGCQLMQIVVRNEGEAHHVHHNHFVDVPQGKTNNGYETLQLITEGNPFDPEPGDCGTVIEHNLFERYSGEAEIISVKSNGNTVRANTFRKSRGSLVLRTGDGNVVSRNVFLGDGESWSRWCETSGRRSGGGQQSVSLDRQVWRSDDGWDAGRSLHPNAACFGRVQYVCRMSSRL